MKNKFCLNLFHGSHPKNRNLIQGDDFFFSPCPILSILILGCSLVMKLLQTTQILTALCLEYNWNITRLPITSSRCQHPHRCSWQCQVGRLRRVHAAGGTAAGHGVYMIGMRKYAYVALAFWMYFYQEILRYLRWDIPNILENLENVSGSLGWKLFRLSWDERGVGLWSKLDDQSLQIWSFRSMTGWFQILQDFGNG